MVGPLGRVLRLLAALALTVAMFVGLPAHPAQAAGDTVDAWRFTIQVDDQGLVHVTETLTYRFGSN